MKKIEELLYTQGDNLKNISAPDSLNEKLNALKFPERRIFDFKKLCVSCAAVMLLIAVFTVTAVGAGYSDFSGFDSVTVDTVAEAINRENAFQPKNISHTFKNGTIVTIDGCVADSDRIMIFGTADKEADISFALRDKKNREISRPYEGVIDFSAKKYSFSFEIKPKKLKDCRIQIVCGGESQIFELAPDITDTKKRVYKIKEDFECEGTKIDLKSLEINMTSCVLNYKISLPKELRKQSGWFENEPEIYILADGKKLELTDGSMSSFWQWGKLSFSGERRFEPIPPQTRKIELVIEKVPVLKTQPVKLPAVKGAKAKNESVEFEILENENGKVTVRGNCLFFKDSVTAERAGSAVTGRRVNRKRNEEEKYGYTHFYEFDGDVDSITIGKYVCNVEVNKKIELR